MTSTTVIDLAIDEAERARQRTAKGRNRQVRSLDEIDYLKTIAYGWFNSHRPALAGVQPAVLDPVNIAYKTILDATAKNSARVTYVRALKDAKTALTSLRSSLVLSAPPLATREAPPNFSTLAGDAKMRAILERRWEECQLCLEANAHLAATVMMGGLLEALFVARANKLQDKKPLFTAKSAPVDPQTKKTLAIGRWTLAPYLDVGHELGWITLSGKNVAAVLRDYRNYIHPEKERSHGIVLSAQDSDMFWQVTKSLAKQLLAIP